MLLNIYLHTHKYSSCAGTRHGSHQFQEEVIIDGSEGCPAALVLAGPVLLKVKMKFHFYEKQVIT